MEDPNIKMNTQNILVKATLIILSNVPFIIINEDKRGRSHYKNTYHTNYQGSLHKAYFHNHNGAHDDLLHVSPYHNQDD